MAEPTPPAAPLTLARLREIVRARQPGAVFIEERVLRRVVRAELDLGGVAPRVPHDHCYALPRGRLTALVAPDELDVPADSLPELLYLLPIPGSELDTLAPAQLLRRTWRLLFHARVDAELRIRTDGVSLPRARVLACIDALGQTPFDEIRAVLHDEDLIPQGASDTAEFTEFVALYQELRYFSPRLLPRYFPSLRRRDRIEEMLDDLVDARALFAETRLPGAADHDDPRAASAPADAAPPCSPRRAERLLRRAVFVREHGNDARAAVLGAEAAPTPDPDLHDRAATTQDRALASLGRRLAAATHDATSADAWAAALPPLTAPATHGMRRLEARLLHDLQKACVAAEREVFEVDLGRWLRRLGRGPLRHPLPARRLVDIARHLRRARARLPGCQLAPSDRAALRAVLDDAVRATEADVRRELGATLRAALDDARLVAANLPEQVAADKLVAELLDRILDKGFIAFGDVRDALARNQLKLRDLASVGEFLRGDALLRLDRLLEQRLDRVYQRGEVYRRGLQRLSSLGFANPIGRALVLYALLPFGAAFVVLEGLQHIVGPLVRLFGGEAPTLLSTPSLLALGAVLLLLLHAAPARRVALAAAQRLGDALRFVFSTLPQAIQNSPPVQWLRSTQFYILAYRVFFRPLQVALLPTLVAAAATGSWTWAAAIGAGSVALGAAVLSTRLGRRADEELSDRLSRGWHRFRHGFLPGLFDGVMAFFKATIDFVEIRLYQVDQWLRFRRGDRWPSLVGKATFGLFWSVLAYIFRFGVNLLLEPQVNPIKHFPVVTVSHKLILPMTPQFIELYRAFFDTTTAATVGVATVTVIPGIFGFLVWEFKENWRIYAENRKAALAPVLVGSHGESVYRLLRPGFHSGTVPKHFRKLRAAERHHDEAAIRHQLEGLHHAEEALARFVTRELIALLRLSGRFPHAHALEVTHVTLTPFRVAVDLACPPLGPEPLRLHFDEQSRFLVAGLGSPGWLPALAPAALAALETALLGLYKLAGVDLVREQIAALLPGEPPYDVDTRGLLAWPGEGFETEVRYALRARGSRLHPRVRGPGPSPPFPVLAAGDLFFRRRPLAWARWVTAWSPGEAAAAPLADLLGARSLFAPSRRHAGAAAPACAP